MKFDVHVTTTEYPKQGFLYYLFKNMFMSWKSEKVSMPMSSAGILGISQGEVLEGIQIDPRAVIIGVIVLVAVIKVLSIFLVPGS